VKQQYEDNCQWIKEAGKHNLVVGSQARILYSDMQGRVAIAEAFNQAIADGTLTVCFVVVFFYAMNHVMVYFRDLL
jgi:urocanate hydratase